MALLSVLTSVPPTPMNCSGEQIYSSSTGGVSVSFSSSTALECAFVLRTSNNGVTLQVSQLSIQKTDGSCDATKAGLHVYDGTTSFDRMLANYTCQQAWSVGSTGRHVLVVFETDAAHSGSFAFSWSPSTNTCGNGICEPSADEYRLCSADCSPETRAGPLPPPKQQYSDTKWCPTFDRLRATSAATNQTTSLQYTVSHIGPPLPADGLVLTLARSNPFDACTALTSVTSMDSGTDVSPVLTSRGLALDGAAHLSSLVVRAQRVRTRNPQHTRQPLSQELTQDHAAPLSPCLSRAGGTLSPVASRSLFLCRSRASSSTRRCTTRPPARR